MKRIEKESTYKKEYTYIIICSFVMVALLVTGVLIFLSIKDSSIVHVDSPSYTNINSTLVDSAFEDANFKSLRVNRNKALDITYQQITDYYKKNIRLSDVEVKYINYNFVVYSVLEADVPFISVVSRDGTIKFISSLEISNINNIEVKTLDYLNGFYYVIANAAKGNNKIYVIYKVSENGEIVNNKIVDTFVDGEVSNLFMNDNIEIISTSKEYGLVLYSVDYDLKKVESVREENKQFGTINDSMIKDDKIYLLNRESKNNYLTICSKKLECSSKSLKDISNYDSSESARMGFVGNSFYMFFKNKISLYDLNVKLVSSYDYNKLELEDPKTYEYNEDYKDTIGSLSGNNSVKITTVDVTGDSITISYETYFSKVYDVFDYGLNIYRRYIYDRLSYNYQIDSTINNLYVGGKIYSFYTYGFETPSLLVSVLG